MAKSPATPRGNGRNSAAEEPVRLKDAAYDELRTLVLGARCVVTDLPHVTVWAKDFGKDLMAGQEDGIRTRVRTPAGKEVLQAIGHLSRQREDAMVLPLWPTSGGGDPRYAAGP